MSAQHIQKNDGARCSKPVRCDLGRRVPLRALQQDCILEIYIKEVPNKSIFTKNWFGNIEAYTMEMDNYVIY